MVGAWGKKESWREVKRLTWIGWEHTTNFLGRAEDWGGMEAGFGTGGPSRC